MTTRYIKLTFKSGRVFETPFPVEEGKSLEELAEALSKQFNTLSNATDGVIRFGTLMLFCHALESIEYLDNPTLTLKL